MGRQQGKIEKCSQKRGLVDAKGIISIELTIEKSGQVSDVEITNSTVEQETIHSCVIFWVKAARFPSFSGKAITETARFVFN